MAVIRLTLEVEEAHEMGDDGEIYGIQDYFVRGDHYTNAFWLAMRRHMAEMDDRDFRCSYEEFMEKVRHVWWFNEPHYDEDTGEPTGSWWYREGKADTPGAYPVTVIDRYALEPLLSAESHQDEVG